jgi:uncharacterized protein (TIGR02246 family)
MTTAVVLSVALFCAAPAAQGTTAPQERATGNIDQAIRRVADDYVKATLAGDAKAIVALYTEDAVEMPPNQPLVKGRAAIQQYYEKLFASGLKVASFTLNHIETRGVGDTAYDVGTYQQNLTPPGATAASDATGKYVVILKRSGGAWKVAYAIYSGDRPDM